MYKKSIDRTSHFTLPLDFKCPPVVQFCRTLTEYTQLPDKAIKIPFPTATICGKLNFLYIFQPVQHIASN